MKHRAQDIQAPRQGSSYFVHPAATPTPIFGAKPLATSGGLLRRAVFLDRDGVLNETDVRNGVPYPPPRVEDVRLVPGVKDALTRLKASKFHLIVVTNQPDVARGTQTAEMVHAINAFLKHCLPLDAVYTCFHDTSDKCTCRKPLPGMLTEAAKAHQIDLSRSAMVGDRWSDIAAGAAAGCSTFLIDRPYSQGQRCTPSRKVADLTEAAHCILADALAAGE